MPELNQEPKVLTAGQKAMGVSFNPSKDPVVDVIKQGCADLADLIYQERDQATEGEQKAMWTIALRHLQTAQMWMVKSQTYQP